MAGPARRVGSVLGAAAFLALGGVAGLGAQEPPPDTAAADTAEARPFVRGGVYDRPYLGRLLGRTAVGGYAEVHARLERVDGITVDAGFVAKRFNLFTATQVSDFVRIGAELEFEEGAEEIRLEFAAIDLIFHPALTLRGGMILSPLGRFNLAHDSPLNPFTDRPLVSTELLGVALSEPGLGVLGGVGMGGAARISYEAYLTNGFDDGVILDSPEGTRLPAGRGNLEDNNASPAFVGRLAWSPEIAHEIGLSLHYGAYNRFEADGEPIDERRTLRILVLDAETSVLGFVLGGEGALVRLDVDPGLAGIIATRQQGFYLDAERVLLRAPVATMPGSTLSAKARLDAVDFDADLRGDSEARITLGLTFRPTADTALKLDYARGRTRDRFNVPAETAALLFSMATYF